MPKLPPKPPQGNWEGILDLARLLRGPQGCPWDASRTVEELAGHLVEESYEVLHAARQESAVDLAAEIGDVCFLVALLAAAHEDAGGAAFGEIASGAIEKITRRHPRVFGRSAPPTGQEAPDDPPETLKGSPERMDARRAALRWERIKREERRGSERSTEEEGDLARLPPAPPALPALLQALRVQQKAAGYGFDWASSGPVFAKVEEELAELRQAADPGQGLPAIEAPAPQENSTPSGGPAAPQERRRRVHEEAGDLLFAAVNLIRLLGLDPEDALREATRKFRLRFNRMAELAAGDGLAFETLPLERMDTYWTRAKVELSSRGLQPQPPGLNSLLGEGPTQGPASGPPDDQ